MVESTFLPTFADPRFYFRLQPRAEAVGTGIKIPSELLHCLHHTGITARIDKSATQANALCSELQNQSPLCVAC